MARVFPEDVAYTREHEWVRRQASAGVRVGITDFAQKSLGDIVFVTLPAVGAEVAAGEPCGELESTKSVSDVFAPVSGTVSAVNPALDGSPELVNSDPYGEGWMFKVAVSSQEELAGLLDAAATGSRPGERPGRDGFPRPGRAVRAWFTVRWVGLRRSGLVSPDRASRSVRGARFG